MEAGDAGGGGGGGGGAGGGSTDAILYQGLLTKRGRLRKTWKRRWFALLGAPQAGLLRYFAHRVYDAASTQDTRHLKGEFNVLDAAMTIGLPAVMTASFSSSSAPRRAASAGAATFLRTSDSSTEETREVAGSCVGERRQSVEVLLRGVQAASTPAAAVASRAGKEAASAAQKVRREEQHAGKLQSRLLQSLRQHSTSLPMRGRGRGSGDTPGARTGAHDDSSVGMAPKRGIQRLGGSARSLTSSSPADTPSFGAPGSATGVGGGGGGGGGGGVARSGAASLTASRRGTAADDAKQEDDEASRSFQLRTSNREISLVAPSRAEMLAWICHIRSCISVCRGVTPPVFEGGFPPKNIRTDTEEQAKAEQVVDAVVAALDPLNTHVPMMSVTSTSQLVPAGELEPETDVGEEHPGVGDAKQGTEETQKLEDEDDTRGRRPEDVAAALDRLVAGTAAVAEGGESSHFCERLIEQVLQRNVPQRLIATVNSRLHRMIKPPSQHQHRHQHSRKEPSDGTGAHDRGRRHRGNQPSVDEQVESSDPLPGTEHDEGDLEACLRAMIVLSRIKLAARALFEQGMVRVVAQLLGSYLLQTQERIVHALHLALLLCGELHTEAKEACREARLLELIQEMWNEVAPEVQSVLVNLCAELCLDNERCATAAFDAGFLDTVLHGLQDLNEDAGEVDKDMDRLRVRFFPSARIQALAFAMTSSDTVVREMVQRGVVDLLNPQDAVVAVCRAQDMPAIVFCLRMVSSLGGSRDVRHTLLNQGWMEELVALIAPTGELLLALVQEDLLNPLTASQRRSSTVLNSRLMRRVDSRSCVFLRDVLHVLKRLANVSATARADLHKSNCVAFTTAIMEKYALRDAIGGSFTQLVGTLVGRPSSSNEILSPK